MRFFCTYFDSRYLSRGLALHESLRRHAGEFHLTVLCLDQACRDQLTRRNFANVTLLGLPELEAAEPELARVKRVRSVSEFYFTITPCLVRRCLADLPEGEILTYLDADLYFFADPQPIFDELGDNSVAIIPHNFPPALEHLNRFGRFNVGWVSFRNDIAGRECLEWWRERCLEWCFDRYEEGLYADQAYLDRWQEKFENVIVIEHPGANVAPWNIARHPLRWHDGRLEVAEAPLLFYHFHALRQVEPGVFDSGLGKYGVTPDAVVRERLYRPYLAALHQAAPDSKATDSDILPRPGRASEAYLDEKLVAAERDRDARLRAIWELQASIDSALADSRAQVHVIQNLSGELRAIDASPAWRAAKRIQPAAKRLHHVVSRARVCAWRAVNRLRQTLRPRPAPAAPPRQPIISVARAQALDPQTPADLLATIHRWGEALKKVLVLGGPGPLGWQTVYQLRESGTDIIFLDPSPALNGKKFLQLEVFTGTLRDWLRSTAASQLERIEGIVITGSAPEAGLNALAGRMRPGQRILLLESEKHPAAGRVLGEPHVVHAGAAHYFTPPKSFLGPLAPAAPWISTTPTKDERWPKFSIVTVTLNQGDYLEETIESVLAQDYPNLEYILLDGGSTDNTPAILEKYRDRLAYCVSKKDDGQGAALNDGFRRATGEIFAWLNSDDRYPPGTLWQVAETFRRHRTDLVVGGCALYHDRAPEPRTIHHPKLPLLQPAALSLDALLDLDKWMAGDFFFQPEVFWTRDIWERAGGRVDPALFYSMDYELWVRMAAARARVTLIPEVTAKFRVHAAQKTAGESLPFLPELKKTHAALLEAHRK